MPITRFKMPDGSKITVNPWHEDFFAFEEEIAARRGRYELRMAEPARIYRDAIEFAGLRVRILGLEDTPIRPMYTSIEIKTAETTARYPASQFCAPDGRPLIVGAELPKLAQALHWRAGDAPWCVTIEHHQRLEQSGSDSMWDVAVQISGVRKDRTPENDDGTETR